MASFLQILCAAFGHCADFRGGCFNLQRFPVRPNSAKIRAGHRCPAQMGRENLFRGLLFCDCCGHLLTLSRKKLKDREVDIYLCTHHNRRPDECSKSTTSDLIMVVSKNNQNQFDHSISERSPSLYPDFSGHRSVP